MQRNASDIIHFLFYSKIFRGWVIFRGFSLTPSYVFRVAPQFICEMKGLIKILHRGKFHRYSFCGSQVIKFQMFLW